VTLDDVTVAVGAVARKEQKFGVESMDEGVDMLAERQVAAVGQLEGRMTENTLRVGRDCNPAALGVGVVAGPQSEDGTEDDDAAGADVGAGAVFANYSDFHSHNLRKEHSALEEAELAGALSTEDYMALVVEHAVAVQLLQTTILNNLVDLAEGAGDREEEEAAEAYSLVSVRTGFCSFGKNLQGSRQICFYITKISNRYKRSQPNF